MPHCRCRRRNIAPLLVWVEGIVQYQWCNGRKCAPSVSELNLHCHHHNTSCQWEKSCNLVELCPINGVIWKNYAPSLVLMGGIISHHGCQWEELYPIMDVSGRNWAKSLLIVAGIVPQVSFRCKQWASFFLQATIWRPLTWESDLTKTAGGLQKYKVPLCLRTSIPLRWITATRIWSLMGDSLRTPYTTKIRQPGHICRCMSRGFVHTTITSTVRLRVVTNFQ